MANTQSKVGALKEQNSKLIAEIAELRKENAKLKQIIEENEKHNVRVEELEQKNIELETRLAILEQGKEEKSISTEDVSHSPVKSNDTLKQIVLHCGDTPVSDITDDTLNSDDTSEQSRVSDSSLTIPPIYVKSKSSEDERIDNFLNEKRNEQIRNEIRERNRKKKLLQSNEAQAQNSYSDSSPKSHDELHVKQFSESQSIPNTPNLPEESSEQNTDLQKTKIPEIDVQHLIEELRIEPLVEDTVKVVNVDKNSTDEQSLAIELHFEKRLDDILPENQRNDKRAYDLASGQIYDEMLQYLSEDKIKRIKTYSANKLSKLTDVQIDTIKKHFIAIPHPKDHCSAIDSSQENKQDSKSPEVSRSEDIAIVSGVNISTKSISIAEQWLEKPTDSEKLPNTEESISQVNKSRPPISVLPVDPEKKEIMLSKWYWSSFLI
ncbi:9627_t:CDS:2 [Gigaspora rosea]|nr:9627_t:CDS:2 [Gigaspora rosea]